LDDLRRIDRAITIGEAMAASPGKSLPQIFAHPYDLKAAYKFFRHPESTPDNLQAGHRERVLCEMEKPGRYLIIEDTSEVLCTETGEIIGLGPVGASKDAQIGFHLHSALAIAGRPILARRRAARVWRFWAWPINSITCGRHGRCSLSPVFRGGGFFPPRNWNRLCGRRLRDAWGRLLIVRMLFGSKSVIVALTSMIISTNVKNRITASSFAPERIASCSRTMAGEQANCLRQCAGAQVAANWSWNCAPVLVKRRDERACK